MPMMVKLDPQQLEMIARVIPGGESNLQETCPLTPLQEGMLLHFLNGDSGDTYIQSTILELSPGSRGEDLVEAIQKVIDRHDVLRSFLIWEGVENPLLVIQRTADLHVEEVQLDDGIDLLGQSKEMIRPGRLRIDLQKAPLIRLQIASDSQGKHRHAVLQLHHVICDFSAWNLVLEEALTCLQGREHELSAPLPYASYLAQVQARAVPADADSFFRRKLGDFVEPSFPFGVAESGWPRAEIMEARDELSPALSLRIRTQAKRIGVSAARLFHAAWGVLVGRCSGQDDVVFGTVVGARRRAEQGHDVVGMFVNTVPLRLKLQGVSAKELVDQTDQELRELQRYDGVPLTLAHRCSALRGAGPLFNAILNYRHTKPDKQTRDSESGFRIVARGEAWSTYPVGLMVDDIGEGFVLAAQTDGCVDPWQLRTHMLTVVSSLVEALEHAKSTPVMRLSMLTDAEERQIVRLFNATDRKYSRDALVTDLFEQQVRKTPNRVALTYGSQNLTYIELNARANQLARFLREKGVGPEQRVAICFQRSPELVATLLGVMKAGGAYVPIDPGYPAERMEYMLKDAAPRIVLTQKELRPRLPQTFAEVIAVDEAWRDIDRRANGDLCSKDVGLQARHLAYTIYTSGSTGLPKGVMVDHAGLLNYLHWATQTYISGFGEAVPVQSSIAFDATVTSLYCPLLTGGAVALVADGQEVEGLEDMLRQPRKWSLVKISPAHLKLLGDRLRAAKQQCNVGAFVIGGEALPSAMVAQWRSIWPNSQLVNEYGPTETVVGCSVYEIPQNWLDARSVPIGRPIANVRIYILDSYLQPVPIGVVGEVYIGGAGVARGYSRRPSLTAERFLADPFERNANARMYRAGDLGRWRADGNIEYLGRNDHQIKLRGYRIELGEIEAVLARHQSVKDAIVIVRGDDSGEKRLVAYLILQDQERLDVAKLREHLTSLLPDYMVPSAYVALPIFPLTANGKVDRSALPVPERQAFHVWAYEAPQGEVEEILAQTWQALLQVEKIGRRDHFFELGGHSLLVVQMMERLRRAGFVLTARGVYERPTLTDLARTISRGGSETREVPPNSIPTECQVITPEMLPLVDLDASQIDAITQAVPGGAANIQDIYPLVPLQEGILFHHLVDEEHGDPYVLPTILLLSNREKLQQFVDALQLVIQRHDILRTAAMWEKLPNALQVVCRTAKLHVEELFVAGGEDPIERLKERMLPKRENRLDVRRAPMMRLLVAPHPDGLQWYVLLQVHHLICDHESTELMFTEVIASLEGRADELPEPGAYRERVARSLEFSREHGVAEFFNEKLSEVDTPTAPFGIIDSHSASSQGAQEVGTMDDGLTVRVRRQARRLGVSAATIFHAAWAVVVSRTTDQDVVVFGTVLSGRLRETEGPRRTLGMYMNTLPLRIRLRGVTARELVLQTQRELVDVLNYEQASLAVAQRCSGVEPPTPLFTSLLNYRHTTKSLSADLASSAGVRFIEIQSWTNYPIVLSVDDMGEGFVLTARTDRRIGPRQIIEHMDTALHSLVRALEDSPQTAAGGLSILTVRMRQELIESFNVTRAEPEAENTVQGLFEEQAAKTPDATAAIFEDTRVSYAELNAKANQLCNYLKRRGVRIGEYIPIVMSRSLQMVIAQLAVLKCGGAYVPVDTALPAERKRLIIMDCGARRIISSHEECMAIGLDSIECIDWSESAIERLRFPTSNPKIGVHGRGAAYVMYTSGSSGAPKGVVVSHRAIGRLVRENGYTEIDCRDCVAHWSNPAFDAATFEVYAGLLNGARVLIVPQESALDPSRFAAILMRHRVTVLWLTIGLFAQNFEAFAAVFNRLRYLITGGDTVDPTVARRVLRQSPPQHLLNAYGPTECTTFSTTHLVESVDEGTTTIPIGRAVSSTEIYILDSSLEPVPIGVTGEIYIGGAGVGIGYLNRPGQTAERFVPDFLGARQGERLYRTGDLGRWRKEGIVEFVGRNDQQVKVRGFRVELGDVEAQLRRHPRVGDAVVVARSDVAGSKHLVAYISCAGEGAEPTIRELREFVAGMLPEYMVPSAFVIMENLPLTRNGKHDRSVLPSPPLGAYALRGYEAPQGVVERLVGSLWEELLGVARVGRHDGFFELGGHSLLAIKVVSRINQAFDSKIRVLDVYNNPILCDLAARISGREGMTDLVDLSREATLKRSIFAAQSPTRRQSGAILLTGATGFVGRFLLAQLLLDSDAMIYCLVRSSSSQEASFRLKQTMVKWGLWSDRCDGRIVTVTGDLRLPRLGIDSDMYKVLETTVETIYHCGSSMNHLETYGMAKPANVGSTVELLKLATSGASKLINYISTLSVFSSLSGARGRAVDETTTIDGEKHLFSSGYAASKWVGERIVAIAQERGIPCNIFRLGLVWADGQLGRYDELQREYRLLKSCLMTGIAIRNYELALPPTAVDYVARAVVGLSAKWWSGGGVFHISSSDWLSDGVFELYNRRTSTPLQLVPYYEWIREMERRHRAGQSLPIVPLIEFAFSMDERAFSEHLRTARQTAVTIDTRRTREALAQAGVVSSVVEDSLISLCAERMFAQDPDLRELPSLKVARC